MARTVSPACSAKYPRTRGRDVSGGGFRCRPGLTALASARARPHELLPGRASFARRLIPRLGGQRAEFGFPDRVDTTRGGSIAMDQLAPERREYGAAAARAADSGERCGLDERMVDFIEQQPRSP